MPTELKAEYYAQRASAGLIVTEGTQPSAVGQGYPDTPGLHRRAHRRLAQGHRRRHEAGGRIFVQLMHAGRVAHPGQHPAPPAAGRPLGGHSAGRQMFTPTGPRRCRDPRELTDRGVAATVADFRRAAADAVAAGFDGVEIHGANGYLVNQFLVAQRQPAHRRLRAAPLDNRIRFAVEVATAVADEIGADRTGIRISPGNP